MKIQPIDIDSPAARVESGKPVLKSRLKRLFDRPFTNVLRNTTTPEKPFAVLTGEIPSARDGVPVTEFEPSSVCLTKMVQNFIEESNDKQTKCGRNRCNCFNGNNDSSSDDDLDLFGGVSADSFNGGSPCDVADHLKSLIQCGSIAEKNLLADAAKIVDKNKSTVKRKDEMMKLVNGGLISLDYDSSICKSKWEKSRSFPAGEYEYIDVIIGDERFLIDVDFRSEFNIARQTSGYKALLQSIPFIFVGKSDRLSQIVSLISEAARQSLKKKGLHFPPWRKAEYMRSKWLSTYTRASVVASRNAEELPATAAAVKPELDCAELVFEEKSLSPGLNNSSSSPFSCGGDDAGKLSAEREVKAVTGLALLLKLKP